MTRPVFTVHNGETIHAQAGAEYDATNAWGIAFIGNPVGGDTLRLSGQSDYVTLMNTSGLQVVDEAASLHLTLTGNSNNITVTEMQWRPDARVDVFNSGFKNAADMNAHLTVAYGGGGSGTTLTNVKGGCEILFLGDTALRPGQLVFHS